MSGKIHPKNTLFLREAVGEAEDGDGNKYEATTVVGRSTPLIKSLKTGKYFSLDWEDIIHLAKEAGINKED